MTTPTLEEAIEALCRLQNHVVRASRSFENDAALIEARDIIRRYDANPPVGAASIRAATIEECAKVAESAAAWRAETGSRVDVAARIRSLSNGKV